MLKTLPARQSGRFDWGAHTGCARGSTRRTCATDLMLLELKAGMTPFLTVFQCALCVLAVRRFWCPLSDIICEPQRQIPNFIRHAATCSGI